MGVDRVFFLASHGWCVLLWRLGTCFGGFSRDTERKPLPFLGVPPQKRRPSARWARFGSLGAIATHDLGCVKFLSIASTLSDVLWCFSRAPQAPHPVAFLGPLDDRFSCMNEPCFICCQIKWIPRIPKAQNQPPL